MTTGRTHRLLRRLRGTDERFARRYLAETVEPKLHIGCGRNLLDGWLNSDLLPGSDEVLRLDATRRFPFAANSFAYAYAEHMIGSLPFLSVPVMLRECHRVLVPGGRVRITTLDLAVLIALYGRERTSLQERYLEWRKQFYFRFFYQRGGIPFAEWADVHLPPEGAAGFVINGLMRAWEIHFVYDEPILRRLLKSAGFSGVVRRGRNESDDRALRCLPHQKIHMPKDFPEMESFTLEGTKPTGGAEGSEQAP